MKTKTDIQKALATEKNVLGDLYQELEQLRIEEKQIDKRLEEIKTRIRQLSGGLTRTGEISNTKVNIEVLKRQLEDADKPAVVWLERPWCFSGNHDDYVVSRVTKKRVYVRARGQLSEWYFDKETGTHPHNGAIDVKATFPEGVENWKIFGTKT